jgi:hypothetical protein
LSYTRRSLRLRANPRIPADISLVPPRLVEGVGLGGDPQKPAENLGF